MALERVGLAGMMKFDSGGAVQAMRAPRDELGRFIASENQASASSNQLGGSLGKLNSQFRSVGASIGKAADKTVAAAGALGNAARTLGLAGLPLTAAIGGGTLAAANFEQQMSAVKAVTGATGEEFTLLQNKAKQMGATTVFSATQSAEGLELLGRAGFSTQESIDALGGVMNAAAADSIPLATSADIIANTIRAMGLEAKDATDVADVLALTSARTNTDITGLGEGFKYAAAQAKTMGIDLATTSAALGVLADSGLKGSLAGTSFTNMLVKLSKPSKLGAQYMKELGGAIFETADGSLDLRATLASLAPGLEKITSKTERAAKITEIFGIRGQKAVGAIDSAITSGKFDKLVGELSAEMDGAAGAAERMAKVRLDNFKGQITLLGSAMEGFAIEVFTPFLQNAKGGLETVTNAIGGVVSVMIELNSNTKMTREEMEAKFGPTTVAIAMGIKDAIGTLINAWNTVRDAAVEFFTSITGKGSPELIQTITKWVAIFALVLGVVAPILVAVGGLIAAVVALAPAFEVIGGAIGGVFTPLLIIVGAIALAFVLLRNEGETVGQTFMRIFEMIKKAIMFVINNAVLPFARAFTEQVKPAVLQLWDTVNKFIAEARAQFQAWFSGIIQTVNRLAPLFRGIFALLGSIVGAFVSATSKAFGAILTVVTAILKPIRQIAQFIIGSVVNTLIKFVGAAVALAEKVGINLPPGFKEFAQGGTFTIQEDVSVDAAAGIQAANEAAKAAAEATQNVAEQKGTGARTPEVTANVAINDKRCVEVNNRVNLDGREQNLAAARHKQEINERAGFKATPWQRRIHLEQGSAPAGGIGGGG